MLSTPYFAKLHKFHESRNPMLSSCRFFMICCHFRHFSCNKSSRCRVTIPTAAVSRHSVSCLCRFLLLHLLPTLHVHPPHLIPRSPRRVLAVRSPASLRSCSSAALPAATRAIPRLVPLLDLSSSTDIPDPLLCISAIIGNFATIIYNHLFIT